VEGSSAIQGRRPKAAELAELVARQRTLLMAVLNVTPDSFSDGGRFLEPETAVERGLELAEEGADIIDIGGESTRPGAEPVSEDEEIRRVLPVIEKLASACNVPLSIDTTKASVAERAIAAGATIVNDISGLTMDGGVAEAAKAGEAALILGHIQGMPADMQHDPTYVDCVAEVRAALEASCRKALASGVAADSLAVDPGLGFGKRFEDNIELIRRLPEIRSLGYPVVVGLSRKSFTGQMAEAPPSERLPASIAGMALAVANGADIVRVHDVRESRQALLFIDRVLGKTC